MFDGPKPGRRVEFAPGTTDPMPMRERYRQGGARQQKWMPYIVGFVVLCIGPMRPLLWQLLKSLASELPQLWHGRTGEEEELAWYDQ